MVPRISEVIDDPTPITGPRIDVAARIGWLMRIHRTVAGVSLREMSAAMRDRGIAVSPTTLSRIESEGQRSYLVLDGYAEVLELPAGSLWSIVNLLSRPFTYAPPALPDPEEQSLDRFSEACEAVDEPHPTGGAWRTFARLHAAEAGFGLPRALVEPYVRRLADETGRAVGPAYVTRYEALAQLRTSAYGDLIGSVCQELVLDPDNQLLYHLTSILSDRPSIEMVRWSGGLLRHPSTFVARGASYALQSMLVIGGLGMRDWRSVVPEVVSASDLASGDPVRGEILAQLCAALPPTLQEDVRAVADLPPSPPTGPLVWSRTRGNVHYEFARAVAATACARLDHREEPLLERLLFEALFDPRGVRMSASMFTVACSPFAGELATLLAEGHADGPDPATSAAALRVAAACHHGQELPFVGAWLAAEDTGEFDFALAISGRSGQRLPRAALERGLSGNETTVNRTLYALGMAADPRLRGLARDATATDPVRRAARWWEQRDGRILV
ncbi:MAG: hypothetical protein JWO76_1945 [Nocardioides sp.]|nr:hypothetical protein [Nocardioides sp.]